MTIGLCDLETTIQREHTNKKHKDMGEKNNRTPLSVLVVDDSEDDLYCLQYGLQKAGYFVLTANDGRQALSLALKTSPDIVITDTNMPILQGPYFIKALFQQYKLLYPLKKNPYIIATSDQGELYPNQFKSIRDGKNIHSFKELYEEIVGAQKFVHKSEILKYISCGGLVLDFKEYDKRNLLLKAA